MQKLNGKLTVESISHSPTPLRNSITQHEGRWPSFTLHIQANDLYGMETQCGLAVRMLEQILETQTQISSLLWEVTGCPWASLSFSANLPHRVTAARIKRGRETYDISCFGSPLDIIKYRV